MYLIKVRVVALVFVLLEIGSLCLTQAGLKFMIISPQPSKLGDGKRVSSCPANSSF